MSEDVRSLEFRKGAHFVGLVIKTSLLTLITLGIYRFWQNAKLRRYYWSAIHVNGDPLEYRGTGLEAFLGFLIVLVIVALYLTIVLSGLYFAGLVTFANLESVQIISLVALLPFIYLAQYRFRRYIAARTRWRGIRFGVEKAAVGYMWRALAYLALFVLTLGLSGPYGRFKLDKFMSDRTWLGNFQLQQTGDWKKLWAYYTPLWASMLLVAVGAAMIYYNGDYRYFVPDVNGFSDETGFDGDSGYGLLILISGYILSIIFAAHYAVRSQAYLLSEKLLGGRVSFTSSFTTRGTIWRYFLGFLLASIVATIVMMMLMIVGVIIGLIFSIIVPNFDWSAVLLNEYAAMIFGFLIVIPLYLGILISMSIAQEIFIKAVMIEYFTNNIALKNASALDDIKQRAEDELADADGWGEALDVGFGF